MFEKLKVLGEVIMNDSNALKRFEGLPKETQKKYVRRTGNVLGSTLILVSLGAILNMNRPTPVRVERAQIYDPQADVVKFLENRQITLQDVQAFLDSDERGKRMQQSFVKQGNIVKLSEMDPIVLKTIIRYMDSVDFLGDIVAEKSVPKAIPVRLQVKDS